MQLTSAHELRYLRFESWPQLRHGIFTRQGGVSQAPFDSLNLGGNVGDDPRAVRENHQRMYTALDINEQKVCSVWQVHSNDVVIAQQPILGRRWLAQADGMITDQPGVALSMRFADCTPLLFFDPHKSVIAIAHAGWRGTVLGIGAQVIRTMMAAYNCHPGDIQMGIGPSIGPQRYQVGEEVVNAVNNYFGTTDGLIHYSAVDGTAYLDLWAANALDARRTGVEHIEIAELCTASNTDLFFSHRAEKGQTGRFGAVISL